MWRAGRATEETSSGASRTRPIFTHLAARQGRRQARGPCVAPPRRRSAAPQVGMSRSCGVPGADRATIHEERRSSGRAAACSPAASTRGARSRGF